MVEMTILYNNSLESLDMRLDDDYTDECTKPTVHATVQTTNNSVLVDHQASGFADGALFVA